MIFEELTLQGFKSFKEPETFVFPKEPGLYFIGGKNLVDPELGSNGAGKSSTLDGACWVLYGKTSIGLKASDVGSWDRSFPCKGDLRITVDDVTWEITRTWSPNSLKVGKKGEKKTIWSQAEVDDLIGLNMESFLRSVMFSQFGDQYFDLSPADKTKILVPILDLGIWDFCIKSASDNKSQMQGSFNDTEKNVASTKGYLQGIEALDYTDDIRIWAESQEEQEQTVRDALAVDVKAFNEIKETAKELLDLSTEITSLSGEYEEGLAELKTRVSDAKVKVQQEVKKGHQLSVRIKIDKEALQQLEKLNNEARCSRCGQEISEEHIENEASEIFKTLDVYEADFASCQKRKEELQDAVDLLEKEQEEYELQGMDLRDARIESQHKIATMKSKTKDLQSSIGIRKRRLAQIQDEVNPFVRKQQDHNQHLTDTRTQIAEHEKELAGIEVALSELDYWATGFKKLRLYVMREILSQFTMEVNNSLQVLGMSGWEIDLRLDKENKGGGIRNEFTVFVKGPENTEFVNWNCWSGGERHRLRFAGSLGLANLIKSSKGLDIGIEFFDEPTNWMSEAGILGALETLKDRAISEGKVIMLIDHKNMEDFEFNGEFMVTKDNEGTHFET